MMVQIRKDILTDTTGTVGSFNNFSSFYLTFYRPNAPTGLIATSNNCNSVPLSWTAPSNIRNSTTNTYYVYRGNSYIGNTTSTSFTDNSPSDGVSYDYKVRMTNGYNFSEYSSTTAGNSKPVPVAPSNMTASSDKCDGTIYVQWIWTAETPTNFQLQRSTSQYSGFTDISSSLPGDINYYEDTPPSKNVIYYYKVRAKNDCDDWGAYSSEVTGSAPDAPTAPSNANYSITNDIVHLTWTDNSFNETNFVVTRTNLITGVFNTYNIGQNVISYDDDKAQLCIPYEYEIEAVNNCGTSTAASTGSVILSPDLSTTFTASSFKTSKGFYPDIVHLEWDNNNRNQIDSYHLYRKVYGSSDSTLLATVDGAQATFDDKYAENGVVYEYSIVGEGLCDTVSVWSNVASDIGFRNPSAVVSGKITYGSGEPVKGITVSAESSEVPETSSMQLDGTSSYLEIPGNSSFDIQNAFTFQVYLRLSQIKNSAVFNKGSQYALQYTGTAFDFSVGTNKLSVPYDMPLDTFVQVSVVFDGSTSFLYLDGELIGVKKLRLAPVVNNSTAFNIGKLNTSNYFIWLCR